MLDQFPKLLQYGVSGLVVILAFLTFLLLRQQIGKPKTNHAIVKTIWIFMGMCFLSAVVVAVSTFYQGESRQAGAAEAEGMYKQAYTRIAANRLESALEETRGKGDLVDGTGALSLDEDEISYRRLRRAVFLNLLDMQADEQLIRSALEMLVKRGHADVGKAIEKLLGELPRIKSEKLQWLQTQAIPGLQKDLDFLQAHPMEQRQASAKVALPKVAWILNHEPSKEPTATVTSMALLQEEVETIRSSIH